MKKNVCLIYFALILLPMAAQDHLLPGYKGFWHYGIPVLVSDLFRFTDEQLPVLRNEIYARYGRSFTSDRYREHFKGQAWYREVPAFKEDWVPVTEQANAALIQSFEKPKITRRTFIQKLLMNIEYQHIDDLGILIVQGKDRAGFYLAKIIERGSYGYYYDDREMTDFIVWGDWLILYRQMINSGAEGSYMITCLRLDHDKALILERQQSIVSKAIFEQFLQRHAH